VQRQAPGTLKNEVEMGFHEDTSATVAERAAAAWLRRPPSGHEAPLPAGKGCGGDGSGDPTAGQPSVRGESAFLQGPTTLRCFTGFGSQRFIISL